MAFNNFFVEMVLPFLLTFIVVFAILQKSKILGADKRQIDSLVALVVGLLVVGLPVTRNFIVDFIPWISVGIAVILAFFLLYGFVAGDLSGTGMSKGMKIGFGVLAGLFVLGVLIYVTGLADEVGNWFGVNGEGGWTSLIIILLVAGAAIWVVVGKKGQ